MNKMPWALKIILGVAAAAVIIVVVTEQRAVSQAAGWDALSAAEAAGGSPESLQTASQAAHGTDAEPWVELLLARSLYDAGGKDQLERARLVAQQALDRHPEGEVAGYLRQLVAAIDSFVQLGAG
ncbi:MAG TPA: hypothetical protein VFY71_07700 [Planctomycetota bacterium]|nr:hypothetical protein [Planctomycetota bacterium]